MPTRRRFRRRFASLVIALNAASFLAGAQAPCEPCAQARALRAEGKSKDAAALLKKTAKVNKDSAELQGLIVLCALDLSRPNEAGAALPKFLANQPTKDQFDEVREAVARLSRPPPPSHLEIQTPEGALPALVVYYSSASYPAETSQIGVARAMSLTATIGVDGTTKGIEVRLSGNPSLGQFADVEDAATAELRRWRFFPASRDGVPVESHVTVVDIFGI